MDEITTGYVQWKKMTYAERIKMYSKCKKKDLVVMLTMRDMMEMEFNGEKCVIDKDNKWHRCKDWSNCTNHNFDRIDCPFRMITDNGERSDAPYINRLTATTDESVKNKYNSTTATTGNVIITDDVIITYN